MRGIGVDFEAQADLPEADRRILGDPSLPRKSRSPSADTMPDLKRNIDRGGDGLQRHARTGDRRFGAPFIKPLKLLLFTSIITSQ